MLKRIGGLFLMILMFALSVQSLGAMDNYYNDQESWDEWEALVQKYPGDMDLHTLHALRIGLCAKVNRGDLTVEDATDIFEGTRERVFENIKAERGAGGKLGL